MVWARVAVVGHGRRSTVGSPSANPGRCQVGEKLGWENIGHDGSALGQLMGY
jgi:hypothetical protein